jgi:hypothetical protein
MQGLDLRNPTAPPHPDSGSCGGCPVANGSLVLDGSRTGGGRGRRIFREIFLQLSIFIATLAVAELFLRIVDINRI